MKKKRTQTVILFDGKVTRAERAELLRLLLKMRLEKAQTLDELYDVIGEIAELAGRTL